MALFLILFCWTAQANLTYPAGALGERGWGGAEQITSHQEYYRQFDFAPWPKDLSALSSFVQKLPLDSQCSASTMSLYQDYIRYLFRLLTISYLFEAIKEYHLTLYRLGQNPSYCSLSWNLNFGACQASSGEMKKFLKRIKSIYLKNVDAVQMQRQSQKEISNWLQDLSHRPFTSLSQEQLSSLCTTSNCSGPQVLGEHLGNLCFDARQLMQLLCSEKDDLWGISYVPKSQELIDQSNARMTINREGQAAGCLNRFVTEGSVRQRNYRQLPDIFLYIQTKLQEISPQYPQGVLYLYGALKEFDDHGLSDFLFVRPTSTPTSTPLAPTASPTATPRPSATPIPTATPTSTPTPTATPFISQFEWTVKERRNKNLERLTVNMELLKNDFVFSEKQKKHYDINLKKYETQKALKDMYKYDQLGSLKGPLSLLFIKYLIDYAHHQGLHNILKIIGPKFYVINDLDRKNEKNPEYVELKNEAETNFQWQISILIPPANSGKKKGP